jgi:hypothetical protein
MAQKLVRIDRGRQEIAFYYEEVGFDVEAIGPSKIEHGGVPYHKQASFFSVDERHIDAFIRQLAKDNPGCPVEVYSLGAVGQCPAGDFVLKEVTKNGVFPA